MRALKKHTARIASYRGTLNALQQGFVNAPVEEAGHMLELLSNPVSLAAIKTLDAFLRHTIAELRQHVQELSTAQQLAQKETPNLINKIRVKAIDVMLNARGQLGNTPAALITSFVELLYQFHDVCNGALNENKIELTLKDGSGEITLWYDGMGVASAISKPASNPGEETENRLVNDTISQLRINSRKYTNKHHALDIVWFTLWTAWNNSGVCLAIRTDNHMLKLQFKNGNTYYFWYEGEQIWHKVNNLSPRPLPE